MATTDNVAVLEESRPARELPAHAPRARPSAASDLSLFAALVRTGRPKQWMKNVLLLAAPGAAGVLASPAVLGRAAGGLVAFCLVSSGTYFLNDVADVESDRRHPVKCRRPVACGALPVGVAALIGILLIAGGIAMAALVGWQFAGMAAFYVALSAAYTRWLKHVAVLDIAVVASGFVIRAVAGGVGARVPISQWFLIVAASGSLFLVAGKRHGEHLELGHEGVKLRSTLGEYSLAYLRYVWMLASGVAMTAYCLWAFEQSDARTGFPWYELSIAPFVLVLLRYALLIDRGDGSAPEDVVLRDRTLQVLGLVWAVTFAGGVHLGA